MTITNNDDTHFSQDKEQHLVCAGAAESQRGEWIAVPCGQVLEGRYIIQGMKFLVCITAFELTVDFTCFFAIWQFDHFCKLDIDNKRKVISVTAVNNAVHCMRISVISLFSLPACSSSVFVLFTCF